MNIKYAKPKNPNYCATVTTIKTINDLENCDNVKGTRIFGEQVVIGKDVTIGDVGIYFPPETQLNTDFLSNNNLYRDKSLNKDKEKAGYFETNGRVRTVKFRGNKSVGFWLPIDCLSFTKTSLEEFKEGDEFDRLKGTEICKKYVRRTNPPPLAHGAKEKRRIKKQTKNKLIENQFRFHEDTKHLAKNIHVFAENSLISITYKMHGTSVIISKLLCKKNLNFFQRWLKKLGVPIIDTEYSNLYASRKVIKNGRADTEKNHFYNIDIWGKANDVMLPFVEDGITLYGEVVGHLTNGGYIQKPYDYGCAGNNFEVYVYRITYTNPAGKVFEFSAKQVQDWCKERGLKAVPQLFYGYVGDFCKINGVKATENDEHLMQAFLSKLQQLYLEKDCYMCKNKVPTEGIVVRIEKNDFEAYKLKSVAFLEFETKQLDKGEVDIEEEQQEDTQNEAE